MNLLIIDIETSKTLDDKDVPVEVAAIAYDTETRCMIGSVSYLIKQDNLIPKTTVHRIPNEEISLGHVNVKNNVLSASYLTCFAVPNDGWKPDALVAHNAEFEQQYIKNDLDIPWLCTYKDFDLFPPDYDGKRDLFSLAQWHGVGVGFSHRALYDCLTLVEVFNRVQDLEKELEFALLPKVEWIAPKSAEHPPLGFRWDYTLQGWIGKRTSSIQGSIFATVGDRQEFIACVDYDNREIAKDWGFQWDAKNKLWTRLANPELVRLFPFKTQLAYIKPLEGKLKTSEDYDYSQNPLIEDCIYGSSS
jgi:DNA polymerase-3 subunit epsilon